MVRSRITGTGSYAPERIVTNHDLEAMVDTTDEWISTRTGIRERRVATTESTAEMAARAGERALLASNTDPGDIDLIVVGTVTPDMAFPSVACFVQSELGIRPGAGAFDVSAACSGFLYAMDVADRYLRSGGVRKALVIGVDRFSRLIDWNDRSTCVLFGDGAGAVVLSAEEGEQGLLASHIHSDGRQWNMLYSPSQCVRSPFEANAAAGATASGTVAEADDEGPYLKMAGNETFKTAVRTMGVAVKEALKTSGLTPEDVTLLIPHQANLRIITATSDRLKLDPDKVFLNLDKYGNTSAGSIPLALDEAVSSGRITEGDIILFVAFGGGLTWASSVVRW